MLEKVGKSCFPGFHLIARAHPHNDVKRNQSRAFIGHCDQLEAIIKRIAYDIIGEYALAALSGLGLLAGGKK